MKTKTAKALGISFSRLGCRLTAGGFSWRRAVCLAAIAGVAMLGAGDAAADGCFVFRWNKEKDINEPTQKAILLYDKGQEDMVLQVKYEGPAEEFGWFIPVPGLPKVRKGSMNCFYELSRLTQRRFGDGGNVMTMSAGGSRGRAEEESVKVIEVKTVGAYEVAVLAATDAGRLGEWLEAHQFAFPKEKQSVLDDYVKKKWYFVAAKIDPTQDGFVMQRGSLKKGPDRTAISPSTRTKLANGELHPLVISFPSELCVFPLAISAVNGKPSEVSLYVLSSEPLTSRVIFDKKFAAYSKERADWTEHVAEQRKTLEARMKELDHETDREMAEMREKRQEEMKNPGRAAARARNPSMWQDDDPAAPPPRLSAMRKLMGTERPAMPFAESNEDFFSGGHDMVWSMEFGSKDLPACCKEMPRLADKTWWLTKQVEVFAPEEMRDLVFEPVVPILAGKLGTADGFGPALRLSQLGACAVPSVLAAWKSSNPIERRQAAYAMGGYASSRGPMKDARLTAVVPGLLEDGDPRNRRDGCYSARVNWEDAFAARVLQLLEDSDEGVRTAANHCLREHSDAKQIPVYRKMVEQDGPGAVKAMFLLGNDFSREQLVHLFSSTNLPVVSTAFTQLRNHNLSFHELEPLLTNSLVMARMMGLGELTKIGDKEAVDRIVAMLHDSNEGIRWRVRSALRRLTGQKLGADPAAYEKWWKENKNDFTPP